MQILVEILTPGTELPTYAHPQDAAFDLKAAETTIVPAGQRVQIPTGLAMSIPEGYVGLIWEKSGLSHKKGLIVLGGVIDSGYTGPVLIGMANLGDEDYTFEAGQKAAQMIIQPRVAATLVQGTINRDTARGDGGFGSTGQ